LQLSSLLHSSCSHSTRPSFSHSLPTRRSSDLIFSRTLAEVTEFPELVEPISELPGELIIDGEILAWRDTRPLPFTELQRRLGRKIGRAPRLNSSHGSISYAVFCLKKKK